MVFGKLEIDPSRSPAVLDTATWDREAARREILERQASWSSVRGSAVRSRSPVDAAGGTPTVSSVTTRGPRTFFLAELGDGQKVFVQTGSPAGESTLGEPFFRLALGAGAELAAYPTDAETIDRFCRLLKPANAPRALGRVPRFGIGTRMTTRVWPGIFSAMDRRKFTANVIQNSVRELNLLDDLKSGREPVRNYASGFGMIESGYTGSTFEGLWVAGVLAALQHEERIDCGADADHIQIKRTDAGLENATRVIEAARYYSFFTVDVADVLSFESMERKGEGELLLERLVTDSAERNDILACHCQPLRIGTRTYRLDADLVGRCLGKYRQSMEAVSVLVPRITALRAGNPFDLEFAFDEHPPEVPGPRCISGEEEVIFVARELNRRGLPVTHIAPNFGVEKGFDYRLPDGFAGLQARVEPIHHIAEETGYLLDFHSADDLSTRARRAIRDATGGRLHYKISPMLHFIFAEAIRDHYPDIFLRWWNDAFDYARVEAEKGSPLAAACLSAYASLAKPSPAPGHEVFRQFFFAYPGRRDASGRFVNREMFYTLSDGFYREYNARVASHLCELADDLFS
ncbi:MAG: tagaturonate epimerase family protein [Spirochaetia bacterium]